MAQPGLTPTLLRDFDSGWNPLLAIALSDVLVSGLTFEGEHLADTVPCGEVGIYYLGSGGQVTNCTIEGFHGVRPDIGRGFGILTGNATSLGTPTVNVEIFNSKFTDNHFSISVAGDEEFNPSLLRTRFTIEGNTITGPGLGPDTIFLAGIIIATGAGGEVKRNTITDHSFTSGGLISIAQGIEAADEFGRLGYRTGHAALLPLQPVRYEDNTFLNNQVHLTAILADESQFVNNTFKGTGPGLVPIGIGVTGDDILIFKNDFSDMPRGIQLVGGGPEHGTFLGITTNPKVIANRFCRVDQPIVIDPLVTGVKEHASKICP